MTKKNKKNAILAMLIAIVGLTCCTKDDVIISTNEIPYLNKKDSTLMVEIYNKIGPWGIEWDLVDIKSWGGVAFALDTLYNEYRIVGFNYNGYFTGMFPEEFCELTELRELGLAGGALSGSIPSSIKQLKKLEWLYIGYNDVDGAIPPEIGELRNLKQLTLGENKLSGKLPEELGNLINLEYLTVMSTNISGEIPKSLSKLRKIKFLYLDHNELEGEFPIEIINPGCVISCIYNNITSMPFDIWSDENPCYIPDLQQNRLSGDIPAWVYKTKKWSKYSAFFKNQQDGFGYNIINN